jgi:amidophosphoribosyltransferase
MCGIVGVVSGGPVNQLIYDALLLLQHRGQDACGMATHAQDRFFMHKAHGMVRDVFRTRNMRGLHGNTGLGQVRYPTAGHAENEAEAQPFYVSAPFGLALVHNGNLTNAPRLRQELIDLDHRHLNTDSDSEVLLNVFAHELDKKTRGRPLTPDLVFDAVQAVHARIQGSYAVIVLIAGHGLLAFRDPWGIRPLCLGHRLVQEQTGELSIPTPIPTVMFASESAAIEGSGQTWVRDIAPGEAVFVDLQGKIQSRCCGQGTHRMPCIFEYVYLARPDSVIDGISVYQARLNLGKRLAEQVRSTLDLDAIDVVIPIPESSRPSAMELATQLNKPYREGFVKNRYVGRTFIMPGQAARKKSVRQKLSVITSEFKGRRVLLVDDSIVRGTTSREIVQMAKEAGAKKVYLASAAPPVRYPNVYGIDMPSQRELIAHGRKLPEIADFIGCDSLIYQSVQDMKQAVLDASLPEIKEDQRVEGFEASCFDGTYITGHVDSTVVFDLQQARQQSQQRIV